MNEYGGEFEIGNKVLLMSKNYGCSFEEVLPDFKFWQGEYGIGWVIGIYSQFYTIGYTEDTISGDFYREGDLKHFTDHALDDDLFEI